MNSTAKHVKKSSLQTVLLKVFLTATPMTGTDKMKKKKHFGGFPAAAIVTSHVFVVADGLVSHIVYGSCAQQGRKKNISFFPKSLQ